MKNLIILIVICFSNTLIAQDSISVEDANKLYDNEQWEESIVAFTRLTKANPVNGENYYKLATALRKLGNYNDSNIAYNKSLDVGYKKGRCIYFIAANHALLGNSKEAIIWIKKGLKTPKSIYYSDLKTDKYFDGIRQLDAFQMLFPIVKKNATRNERWQTDIEFVNTAFETIHYDLYRKISKQEWERSIASLKMNIATFTDDEIITKLMHLVSRVGDGHTFVRPPLQGDQKFHFYPIQLYQFKEGVFVTAINEKYADVVGAELTHIDGVAMEKVLELYEDVLSIDNSMGYKENVYLTMLSEVLNNLGVTKNKTQAEFTFKSNEGETIKHVVDALDFNPALWNVKLASNKDLPLYRSNPGKYFWYKNLPESSAVYLQLNINFSMPDKDIEEFYQDVFEFMKSENTKHLILDIRNCPGGNSFNNKPLIQHILQNKNLQKEGGLFTIIGRKTFSAAMNLATDLEQWTNTVFIGEPTGSSPNFVGETNFIELPYSKLNISISNAYWQRSVSWDERKWIAPEIFIEPSFEAYKTNEDPVMDYILKQIENR